MSKLKIDELENISAYDYYKFYLKNSRLLSLVWFLLTVSITVCLIVIFASPEWIGDNLESTNRGYFGLYKYCTRNFLANSYRCFGTWTNFATLPNTSALKAACFFVGFSCILSIICVMVSVLCFVIKYERVFHFCAWIQLMCFICLFIGITVYPIGWNSSVIKSVCGQEANQLKLGTCSIRWAYVVACIALFEQLFLTLLAFLLAARQAKFLLTYASKYRYDSIDNLQNRI